jgi:hypothetical protein
LEFWIAQFDVIIDRMIHGEEVLINPGFGVFPLVDSGYDFPFTKICDVFGGVNLLDVLLQVQLQA